MNRLFGPFVTPEIDIVAGLYNRYSEIYAFLQYTTRFSPVISLLGEGGDNRSPIFPTSSASTVFWGILKEPAFNYLGLVADNKCPTQMADYTPYSDHMTHSILEKNRKSENF